jgi:FKBP-type peptidyl-prolyl cis-trans isomerase SlyD
MRSAAMLAVADGRVVAIYYTLRDESGKVLDTNRQGGKPLVYLQGAGHVVAGLERALAGKLKDDFVSVEVPPEDGYGAPKPELFQELDRGAFPPDLDLAPGRRLAATGPDGRRAVVTVAKVEGDAITIDRNHPLAGRTLHYEVTIAGVREATEVEREHGHVHGPGGHDH